MFKTESQPINDHLLEVEKVNIKAKLPCFFLGLKGPSADYHLCDRGCQALHIVLLY